MANLLRFRQGARGRLFRRGSGHLLSGDEYAVTSLGDRYADACVSPKVLAPGLTAAWVHDLFTDLAHDAGADDVIALSEQLVILYDGATTTSQMDRTAKPAAMARRMAELVLSSESVTVDARK